MFLQVGPRTRGYIGRILHELEDRPGCVFWDDEEEWLGQQFATGDD